jgi:ABC-type polysaccharide/polyol phosphate export permease
MSATQEIPLAPPPELRYRRNINVANLVRELWRSRSIIRTLAERDLRVRYKQAILGFAWAVLTPLMLMIVFTLFIDRLADIETNGIPYPIFSFIGLVSWGFFSSTVSSGSGSLLSNLALMRKVYCPREVFPIAAMLVTAFDTFISILVLCVMFVILGVTPKSTTVWVPLLFLIQLTLAMGVALFAAAIVVYLRDLRHALPMMLQLGLFASPVAYSISDIVPARFRQLYAALNPMAPVIEGYRRTVLFGLPPEWRLLLPAIVTALLVFVAGWGIFKRLETGLVDVV